MRSDMCAWCQGREEAMEVVPRNNRLKNFNGARNFGAIFCEFDIVQIQIEHVPIARIVAFWPKTIRRQVVLVGIGWWPVWLEASSLPQGHELLSDHIGLSLESTDPLKLRAVPPRLQREARHQIWTSKLPWMINLWNLLVVQLHKEPVAHTLDCLILWIADFVLYELFAC